MATPTFAGPVDYVVFAFPSGASLQSGMIAVRDRVATGGIEVLDIDAVRRDSDDRPLRIPLREVLDLGDDDIAALAATQSNLLDAEDLAGIATALEAGQYALIIIYEDRSLAAAAEAFALSGGVEMFTGAVDIADLETIIEGENIE
ncbi:MULTISPECIES: hypothetical protein [unclassified Microbacterium]|uniref:hypothetical protein n=1 Tax=unclassified Microbacterium TaxID=2609290 RepID=UPI0004933A19|nr:MULTISPECIES: hypothetical protein [unclassified Microbacterium]